MTPKTPLITRECIVRIVSKKTGLLLADCRKIVNETFDTVAESIESENRVSILRLGKWRVYEQRGRKSFMNRKGDPIEYEKVKRVAFKPAEVLRQKLRNG